MAELLIDRIFGNLYTRKLYHFFGGTLMVLAVILLEKNLYILFAVLYFIVFFFFGRRISFAILGVLLLYVVADSKNLAVYTTIIWLVGDTAAALVGGSLGKRRLPWHGQKTILGSVSFLLSSWILVLALLLQTTEAPHFQLFILSTISCLVACLVESLPVSFIRDRKPDDNLTVLLSTGLAMGCCAQILGLGGLLW